MESEELQITYRTALRTWKVFLFKTSAKLREKLPTFAFRKLQTAKNKTAKTLSSE